MGRLSSNADYGTCTQFVRFTFIGSNGFGAVLAVLGVIISIWSLAVSSNTDYGGDFTTGAAILLVSSLIFLGLCVTGIIGGILMNRLFLIIYAIVLALIVFLELASAVISFVFAGKARDALEEYFNHAIANYRFNRTDSAFDEDSQERIENVQDAIKCCGVDSASDWTRLNRQAVIDNGYVPPNCNCHINTDDNCVRFNFVGTPVGTPPRYVWDDGCLDTIDALVTGYRVAVGVVSLLSVFVEILFVVIAIGLTITITRKGRPGVV